MLLISITASFVIDNLPNGHFETFDEASNPLSALSYPERYLLAIGHEDFGVNG